VQTKAWLRVDRFPSLTLQVTTLQEALVKIKSAGINPVDWKIMGGYSERAAQITVVGPDSSLT
jgi:NADPH:quinone reductase-like Zn-dependent oxidoreductase